MKNDNLKELFEDLNFDIAEPETGHQDRFLEKLQERKPSHKQPKIRSILAPFVSVAAVVAIVFMLFGNAFNSVAMAKSGELASVSPEMKQTQDFYTSVIQNELSQIKAAKSPETKAIVEDALVQMQKLESQYEKLKEDLSKSGQDKRVIYAMITNFQQRIDLLNNVLNKIEEIKSLKNQSDENNLI